MEIVFFLILAAVLIGHFVNKPWIGQVSELNARLASIDDGVQRAAPNDLDTKTCPRCAETIRYAAAICRHCGHEFPLENPETVKSVVIKSFGSDVVPVILKLEVFLGAGFRDVRRLERRFPLVIASGARQEMLRLKTDLESSGAEVEIQDASLVLGLASASQVLASHTPPPSAANAWRNEIY